MRILLQHIRTQRYLRDAGDWTANPLDALDFQTSQEAIDFVRENDLPEVQIAVSFAISQFDEIVPVPPRHGETRPRVG